MGTGSTFGMTGLLKEEAGGRTFRRPTPSVGADVRELSGVGIARRQEAHADCRIYCCAVSQVQANNQTIPMMRPTTKVRTPRITPKTKAQSEIVEGRRVGVL